MSSAPGDLPSNLSPSRFPSVDAQMDLPLLDDRVLRLWRQRDVFARSIRARAGAERFVFYEGPPTANGKPGVHHVEARVFKDVLPRFQTMRGRLVERKGGWDCHGLPVELEVEKRLGLADKRAVEAYGVARFNEHCRESVTRYVAEFERLTERIGFWVETDQAYWTMTPRYIESVWWALSELHRRGLLFEDYKVVPYCPRCGTALSDAEVAQGYRDVTDRSAMVRLPVIEGPLVAEHADLLIWTTTPWTLPSNTGVAVGSDIDYVLVGPAQPQGARPVVVARARAEAVGGAGATILRSVSLQELLATRYQRPLEWIAVADDHHARAWRVVAGDFVTTGEGTGLVHLAPAFGADDLRLAREEHLPVLHPVDREGRFVGGSGPLSGVTAKQADPLILAELARSQLLWSADDYQHSYPHCYRCATPLLYYALTSWFARTTQIRDRMLEENHDINWLPEHIREGRFGDWLTHNVDWALSRARYWGTPLPIWRCPRGHVTVVGSLAELSERSGEDLQGFDPHRPGVDAITFPCLECGETATRIPDVLDAWFDSGSMPFAQFGYPHTGSDAFSAAFPADIIGEGIDQTRGWFYSLLAVSTLLFDEAPYRSVLCLGHLVDQHGRKMSKSLGNVLDPFVLLDEFGADTLRWFMLASGSPWVPRRLSPAALEDVARSLIRTIWSTYAFFTLYARVEGFTPAAGPPPPQGLPHQGLPHQGALSADTQLDRWILQELAETVEQVTAALEGHDPTPGARRITRFADDLSNWYVRLSRRRFWRGAASDDGGRAFETLWECLRTLSLLLAPYTPFLAEELWQGLVVGTDASAQIVPDAPDSVHLADWPRAAATVDRSLSEAMAIVRQLVALGRQARTDAKIKVRQPLARALIVVAREHRQAVHNLGNLVCSELNVKELTFADAALDAVTYQALPRFRALGPRFGAHAPAVAAAIRSAQGDHVARHLLAGETVAFEVTGLGTVQLDETAIELIEVPATGWQLARAGSVSVALDLALTPALREEGLIRDVVRLLQEARKQAGLAVDDRILLALRADGEVLHTLRSSHEWIAAETLATHLLIVEVDDDLTAAAAQGASPISALAHAAPVTFSIDGNEIRAWIERVPQGT